MVTPISQATTHPFGGIPVHETKWLDDSLWGYYHMGAIITPNAKRIARNIANLGIDRTGKIVLLPGKTETPWPTA